MRFLVILITTYEMIVIFVVVIFQVKSNILVHKETQFLTKKITGMHQGEGKKK